MANGHGNACVQNAQQCVEKALKAVIIEQGVMPEKTHRTSALLPWIRTHTTVEVSLTADEVDRVDTVYIPSKYPISDALPNGPPTQA
jgi:HEPN domain-containing protein